jgi:four helix bundle protein
MADGTPPAPHGLMTHADLCHRTMRHAVLVAELVRTVSAHPTTEHAVRQLGRAASAAAASYRAAGVARSRREFIAKLSIAIEETDESAFWLEYLVATGTIPTSHAAAHLDESRQLARILTAARNTARRNTDHNPPR